MTGKVVIDLDNLSKFYRLGSIGGGTLQEDLARWWARLRGKPDPVLKIGEYDNGNQDADYLWALRNLSFQVREGEVLGIIGRNGAGKSTLLKILSRITAPTAGRAVIRGRVGSLLEVGTGFHPELSGRENIYLNGSILGMKKTEISRKLEQIIDFSGIEKFIDTPVKRYSSGMSVRLAFSVAAHLEPEILIIDEVLAVGDMAFQKKCLGKLDNISHEGRTVLLVSHNMAMISNLCKTAIFMKRGRLDYQGAASEAVLRYYKDTLCSDPASLSEFSSANAELVGYDLVGQSEKTEATINEELIVRMKYRVKRAIQGKHVPNFHFFSADGSYIFVSSPDALSLSKPGLFQAECVIPANLLNEGAYFVGLALTGHLDAGSFEVEFYDKNALSFNIVDPIGQSAGRYSYAGPIPGIIRPRLTWRVQEVT